MAKKYHMEGIKLYSFKTVEKIINTRDGESKFGEKLNFLENLEKLSSHKAKYVLLGIPEDIGIRANHGRMGASKGWDACLKALLNTQANTYTNPGNVILLGEVDCREMMNKSFNLDEEDPNYFLKLGDLVTLIDQIVADIIQKIIEAGKIPVIIGGGHNNAYGNIKGTSLALKKPLNILNIDAHTDLRTTDNRHSGNGFSYAKKENYLGRYRIFGLHRNYTPNYIFKELDASTSNQYYLFEHLLLKSSAEINTVFREELSQIAQEDFAVELDCDAIRNFPSSAKSPSGFSFNMVRNFISLAGKEENIKYLHICEASPSENSEIEVGKALSYLITDFINPG